MRRPSHGMRTLAIALVIAACGGGGGNTPPGDDAPDAPPDAPPVADDCPNRTAPTGMPSGTPGPGEVVLGDITIRTALDVSGLAGVKVITGDLTIDNTALTAVALPDLEVVQGSLFIKGSDPATALDTVELPRLETVGGFLLEQALPAKISTYHLPRFETAGRAVLLRGTDLDVHCLRRTDGTNDADRQVRFFGHAGTTFPLTKLERGDLTIGSMPNLIALDLPRLVDGNLEIGGSTQPNPALVAVSAPLLANAQFVIVSGSPQLASLAIPATASYLALTLQKLAIADLDFLAQTTLDTVAIGDLDALTSLAGLPPSVHDMSIFDNDALTDASYVATRASLRELIFVNNAALATLDFATLTTVETHLRVVGNPALTRLVAPQLVTVGTGADDENHIENNAQLPTACATAIRDHVLASVPGAIFKISGNGTGTCP